MIRTILIFVGVFLIVLTLGTIISWVVISESHFTRTKLLQDTHYTVLGKEYVQALPIHTSSETPYLLEDAFIGKTRELIRRTDKLMASLGVQYWLSGGSLLGAARNKTIPMHYDDDVDIHVNISHRSMMFSPQFKEDAKKHGLKAKFLVFNTAKSADRHGSAARLCLAEDPLDPTLDVFFVESRDGATIKINGWKGDTLIYSTNEVWRTDDVFPIVYKEVDGLTIPLPRNPESMLKQQYGTNVMDSIVCAHKMLSHRFIYHLLQLLFR